jgi:hypothetical protein
VQNIILENGTMLSVTDSVLTFLAPSYTDDIVCYPGYSYMHGLERVQKLPSGM